MSVQVNHYHECNSAQDWPRYSRRGESVWLALPHNGKLPTAREVVKYLYGRMKATPGTADSSWAAKLTADELLELWGHANIQCLLAKDATKEIEKLHLERRELEKTKKCPSKAALLKTTVSREN